MGKASLYLLANWLIIQFTAVIVLWLRSQRLQSAMWVLLAGLWLSNAVSVLQSDTSFFIYLFAAIPVLAAVLVGIRGAIVTTLVSSAFAIILVLANILTAATAATAILLFWLVTCSNLISLWGLGQVVAMMDDFQKLVVKQIMESREDRAKLASLTRAYSEAAENLAYANTQLYHARKAAEEAHRLKAHFAINVSHGLRTPINLIVGFAEMIVNGTPSYKTPLPSAYWKDVNTIYRNARHLQGLINDILDMSQIEAGQMATVKEVTSPQQVLMEAAELTWDAIEAKGVAFECTIPDDLPMMSLDRIRIRQVVLSLLGNAIRFTDEGKIALRVECHADELWVTVADTGIGIPEDELKRVFDEFYQNTLSVRIPRD